MKETPQKRWDKKNLGTVGSKYPKEFITEYKQGLVKLNITNADAIRNMMNEIIKKANAK